MRIKPVLIIGMLIVSFSVTAQTAAPKKIEVTKDMKVFIPQDKPVANMYVADLTCFGFANEEQAKQRFEMFRNNLIEPVVDFKKGEVLFILHNEYLSKPYSAEDWQKMFDQKQAKYLSRSNKN